MRENDISSTWMRENDNYSTWTSANDIEKVHFQEIMRNDQKMTANEPEIVFMTVNDWYNPFLLVIHEQSLMWFSNTISSI